MYGKSGDIQTNFTNLYIDVCTYKVMRLEQPSHIVIDNTEEKTTTPKQQLPKKKQIPEANYKMTFSLGSQGYNIFSPFKSFEIL